jgi:hypothetical protein
MIVTNETKGPLRVPLGKGKVLHLAPRGSAHVLQAATERAAFQKMVEAKKISVRSEADDPGVDTNGRDSNDAGTQPARIQRKGLR